MAKPLNTLVSVDNANRKKALVDWTDECQVAFEKLKDLCTSTPILAYADKKSPFSYKLMLAILVSVLCYTKIMIKVNKGLFPMQEEV